MTLVTTELATLEAITLAVPLGHDVGSSDSSNVTGLQPGRVVKFP